jgi:MarR family transcriptional regulator, 2-MHQ and catechol-resistance regulon repressor
MRAAESVANRVNRPLSQDDLSISQFGVLEALLHLGPMSQKELAAKILKSHGNISVVVDNLEKRDLVTRTRGAVEDRRVVIVSLTPKGEGLVRSVLPDTEERIRQEMGILSDAELLDLARTCKKLGLHIDTDAAGETPARS